MSKWMWTRSAITLLAVALPLAGCGDILGTKGSTAAPAKEKTGGATPQEAFSKAEASIDKKDWKGFYNSITQETGDKMLAGLIFAGGMTAAFSEDSEKAKESLDALLKKHGVTEEPKQEDIKSEEDMNKAFQALANQVKDKPAAFGELMGWFTTYGKDKPPFGKFGTLKDVKIDGAKATGKIVNKSEDGSENVEDVQFRQQDGRWYMHMDLS